MDSPFRYFERPLDTEAHEVWESIRRDSLQNCQITYSMGVYHFRCLHCDEAILIWDCD